MLNDISCFCLLSQRIVMQDDNGYFLFHACSDGYAMPSFICTVLCSTTQHLLGATSASSSDEESSMVTSVVVVVAAAVVLLLLLYCCC
jgi:hypothetical protein